jgi:hypothetical protein
MFFSFQKILEISIKIQGLISLFFKASEALDFLVARGSKLIEIAQTLPDLGNFYNA